MINVLRKFRKINKHNLAIYLYYKPISKAVSYLYNDHNRLDYSRVFMFHSISKGETDTAHYTSNVHGFERFIRNTMENFTPASIDDVLKNDRGYFAITFDDAFENVYSNAYPILKRYSIPFTIFITIDLIDTKGYLTREELLLLNEEKLCTIGAHTLTHPRLRKCQNSIEEIKKSKDGLEKILGKKIRYFAYPYGSVYACSRKNIAEAKQAGFDAAFSAVSGVLNKYGKRKNYFLPRINADHLVYQLEKENFCEYETSNSCSRV